MNVSVYCLESLSSHCELLCSSFLSKYDNVVVVPCEDLSSVLRENGTTSCVLCFQEHKADREVNSSDNLKYGNIVEAEREESVIEESAEHTNQQLYDDHTLVVPNDDEEAFQLDTSRGDPTVNKANGGSSTAGSSGATATHDHMLDIPTTSVTSPGSITVTAMQSSQGFGESSRMVNGQAKFQTELIQVGPNLEVDDPATVSTESSQSSGPKSCPFSSEDTHLESQVQTNDDASETNTDKTVKEKQRHVLYHLVHKGEEICPLYNSDNLCKLNYDEKLAQVFKHYLWGWKFKDKKYGNCVEDHLTKNICRRGTGCPLWMFCLKNGIYVALKHADEGFVVHSSTRKSMIAEVCYDYSSYKQPENEIGHGGFGKVYKLNETLAVKEEFKRPLIFLNPVVFKHISKLNNTVDDHVIPLLEYIVGRPSEDDHNKRVFLFVMPYMNQGGLHKLFKEYKSVLRYMIKFPDQEECIFKNYRIMFLHVFKGLQYLHKNKIVHGDVKDTNILVHKTCACDNPLFCTCGPCDDKGVIYVLGDMDLFCIHGEPLSTKYVRMARAKCTEPSGTPGMKATELYYTGMKGEKCGSIATDVWAGCVTMMKVLVGDELIKEATKQITEYFDAVSIHSSTHVFNIVRASKIAHKLRCKVKVFDLSKEDRDKDREFIKKEVLDICNQFDEMTQLLTSGELLEQAHWISSYTYAEKLPLPFILGAVHGANSLHQQCLGLLPHIYSTSPTSLWYTMQKVLEIITDGVRFLPENRPDAEKVIGALEVL